MAKKQGREAVLAKQQEMKIVQTEMKQRHLLEMENKEDDDDDDKIVEIVEEELVIEKDSKLVKAQRKRVGFSQNTHLNNNDGFL